MINLILSILLSILAPQHDFHTSWMNMTYNEDKKVFETTWRTDTEHLEGVLTAYGKKDIHLEDHTIPQHKALISKYLSDHTNLSFNGNNQKLRIEIIEVTFAETIIHFYPIKCRRKLKTVSMHNTLLQKQFPNQKNMVQINYKGKMYSMLLGGTKLYDEISIE